MLERWDAVSRLAVDYRTLRTGLFGGRGGRARIPVVVVRPRSRSEIETVQGTDRFGA